jgi:hypothetical protein
MLPRLEAYEALGMFNILVTALGNWDKKHAHERRRIIRTWERISGITQTREPRVQRPVAERLANLRAMGFHVIVEPRREDTPSESPINANQRHSGVSLDKTFPIELDGAS